MSWFAPSKPVAQWSRFDFLRFEAGSRLAAVAVAPLFLMWIRAGCLGRGSRRH